MKTGACYFLERLTLFSWVFYILPHLMRDRLKGNRVARIFFIDGSDWTHRLCRLSLAFTLIHIDRLTFRIRDICDTTGGLLSYRLASEDFAEVEKEIIRNPEFQNILRETKAAEARERLSFYLIKRITAFVLNLPTLWRALLLVQIVRWKTHDIRAGRAVLLMNRSLWRKELVHYAARQGVEYVPVKNSVRELDVIQTFRSAEYSLFRLNGANISPALQKMENDPSPKLAVEYYGHLNLSRPEMYSDLFFWQKSELDARDIVLVFHISRDPLDEKKWSEIRDHGMEAVVLDSRATTLPNAPLFRSTSAGARLNFWKHQARTSERSWLNRQLFYYETGCRYWTDLFERCHMKIFVCWYKYDAAHCVIADAMQSVGGVTTIYQRAYEEIPSPETTLAVDVAFGFSGRTADIERRALSMIPYYVTTGYIGDHRFPLLQAQARDIRAKLTAKGARRIIAFFDENSSNDTWWQHGHELIQESYSFLLEKLLSNPSLGLVFKPKVPSTLMQRLGPVADVLKKVVETGRCVLIGGGEIQGSYPPALAALASDIAIHGHLIAATAGLESALAGIPTLLLDREGWRLSPLYQLGEGRVVFKTWTDLWKACEEHWSSSPEIPGFGDWSPMMNELDPFRDGRAAERIGTYLKWILDGFKSGLPRDTILADAAERYCKRWGKDKVTEVRGGAIERLAAGI